MNAVDSSVQEQRSQQAPQQLSEQEQQLSEQEQQLANEIAFIVSCFDEREVPLPTLQGAYQLITEIKNKLAFLDLAFKGAVDLAVEADDVTVRLRADKAMAQGTTQSFNHAEAAADAPMAKGTKSFLCCLANSK